MAEITRVPLGLQKALGLQNQGDNPSALGTGISPGIDLTRYYDLRQTYYFDFSRTVTADFALFTTVPDGEIWILREAYACMRGTGLTAGDNLRTDLYAENVQQATFPANQHAIAGFGVYDESVATAYYTSFTESLNNIVLFGGTKLTAVGHQSTITTGSISWRCGVQYLRIQI